MRRAVPLPLLAALALGLGAGACGTGPEAPAPGAGEPSTRPEPGPGPPGTARDVLLVTIDTLRADTLGFAGNERVETPVLDRLAAAGRAFTRAHAHNVVTLPSHANILTGRLPYEHGVRDNSGFVLGPELPTAATLFRDAGFATAAVVAAFPLDARFGLDRGFGLYDDQYPEGSGTTEFRFNERRGDEVVARARSWWREHAGERRFLWVHLFDPHAPYEPPEPFASRFADDRYLGEVAAVDAFLAPLLEPFLEGEEDEPALVVVTSDHGEGLGDHGERTHGLFAYEATLRVPLVLWGTRVEPGTSDAAAAHVDLLPTMLDAAGVAVPPELPGRSLLAAAPAEPPVTYFEALSATLNRGWAPLRGVLQGGEKLIVLPIPELYDLAEDPGEERNLYEQERRRARALARLVPEESRWPPPQDPGEGPARGPASGEERRALKSLGYLAGSAPAKTSYGPEDDPKNLVAVDRRVHRFIDLYQRGRLEEATEVARAIVREQPDMGVGYDHLGQVLLERGLAGEALRVLEEARKRGVATPSGLRQLALLYARGGRAPEAVELLRPLVGESAGESADAAADPETLNVLGVALSEAGRQEEARATLERVFRRDPRNPEAHQNLALVALRRQDWQAARDHARRALEGNDRLPDAWNYLGVALYNLGRPAEGLEAWERALDLEPEDFDLLYNLGIVAAQTGDTARARRALERFVADAPPERYGPDIARARDLLRRLPT
ncbi:MAG: tetratricopeptide repeat protein [Thermoanaerobaculia bacterium]